LKKLIFRFNNQSSLSSFNSKNILGGKGAHLAQMAKLKLPVPPGFTISTKVCEYFYKNNKKIPKKVIQQTKKEINIIERITKKKFGGLSNPLLVSVRSGARVSMPGMMDTVLNLGLNNKKEFKKYIEKYGLTYREIKQKIRIETLWNQLIYTKYNEQVKIDLEKLRKKIL